MKGTAIRLSTFVSKDHALSHPHLYSIRFLIHERLKCEAYIHTMLHLLFISYAVSPM